jgi:hypothetical protein
MFKEEYWKEKEERKVLKEKKTKINKALAFLRMFFHKEVKPKKITVINHTRTFRERLIRRNSHATKMRNA